MQIKKHKYDIIKMQYLEFAFQYAPFHKMDIIKLFYKMPLKAYPDIIRNPNTHLRQVYPSLPPSDLYRFISQITHKAIDCQLKAFCFGTLG